MSMGMGYDAEAGHSPLDPSTWATLSASALVMGLDLGMMGDHSALVLAGAWPVAIGVINAIQFPLQTPHEMVADVVATIAVNSRVKIVFDASNNSAFAGIIAARMPRQAVNRVIAAVLTSA